MTRPFIGNKVANSSPSAAISGFVSLKIGAVGIEMRTEEIYSETSVTGQPPNPQTPSRKKLILFALGLGAMAMFMYGSIIVKTALLGP